MQKRSLALRVKVLETQVQFQHEMTMRLIDLVHDQYRLREGSDKELHRYVQLLANKTGQTLATHRKDIEKLVQLVTGKPTPELIDMKATTVWKPPKV